jgi:hypothetical protein
VQDSNNGASSGRRAYGLLRHSRRSPSRRSPHAPARPATGPPAAAPRPAPGRGESPRGHRPAAGIPRHLRLGEFLYHSQVITFSALIETLVTQRRQRERFCDIVLRWSYLSEIQVQTLLAERLPLERVGEAAERLQLLTPLQVRVVLAFQQTRQEPLGRLLVRSGLLTTRHLEQQLSRLTDHNSSLRRD